MTKQITLTRGKVALVDDADYDWLNKYKWHACGPARLLYATRLAGYKNDLDKRGYRKMIKRGMHVEIMKPEPGMFVDHINRNSLDNRRANLRLCTKADNCRNARKEKVNATSKYIGVSRVKPTHKWRANCKKKLIGSFSCEIEAAKAYDKSARAAFGDFAVCNFDEVGNV